MTNRNRAIVSALLAAVVVFASAAPPAAAQDGQQFSLTVVNESSQAVDVLRLPAASVRRAGRRVDAGLAGESIPGATGRPSDR